MEKHSKHYEELMELAKTRAPINKLSYVFTEEEIKFLAKEDLVDFTKKFPAEAEYYMEELS